MRPVGATTNPLATCTRCTGLRCWVACSGCRLSSVSYAGRYDPVKYEYRTEVIPIQPQGVTALLNEWAADGWRLHTALLVLANPSALQSQTVQALEIILEREQSSDRAEREPDIPRQ